MNFEFHPMNFVSSLEYLAKGMIGIFIVTAVIIIGIWLLNFATAPDKNIFKDKFNK